MAKQSFFHFTYEAVTIFDAMQLFPKLSLTQGYSSGTFSEANTLTVVWQGYYKTISNKISLNVFLHMTLVSFVSLLYIMIKVNESIDLNNNLPMDIMGYTNN